MTVVAYFFTLVIMMIKVEEMLLMDDPSIQSFSKPLSDEDR